MDKIYIKKITKTIIILFIIGSIYYIFYTATGIGIPCAFRRLTGLKCPGCGVTHMVVHLSQFEFSEAYRDNQFLFLTWPFIVGELIYTTVLTARHKPMPRINLILLILYIVILLIFGVIRNLFL